MTTYVCYHLPSDKDEADHPNAFAINKQAEDVTLRDVKKAFPLPGEYHFRFKVRMESGSYWLDCTDETANVPVFGPRRIVAKVLRLSWVEKSDTAKPEVKPVSNAERTAPAAFAGYVDLFGSMSPVQAAPKPKAPTAVSDLDLFS